MEAAAKRVRKVIGHELETMDVTLQSTLPYIATSDDDKVWRTISHQLAYMIYCNIT